MRITMFGKAASTAVFSLLISISLNFGSESESQARSGDSANFNRIDSVEVDGVFLRYNQEDRNYLIACVMSEIGNWKDTDYDKMRQKSIAITYVILRRAKRGDFGGGYSIKGNILAPNQFYGMTLNTNSSPFKGKPCANAALSNGPMADLKIFFGMTFFDLMDYMSFKYMLPLGGFLMTIFAAYYWGAADKNAGCLPCRPASLSM